MKKVRELLQAGELTSAIKVLETQLKDDPKNADIRSNFVELLCLNGELERADNQLGMMVKQNPDFLIGAVNLRQLIRAAQTRIDFYQGLATPELFSEPDIQVETLLKLRLALKENDIPEATKLAAELESLRGSVDMMFNGEKISSIRDLDDTLCGFMEIFGTDGKFYLAKFSEIEQLNVKKPTSLMEKVWTRIEISVKNGPSGEAYLPLTYANSPSESHKLGKETDWDELSTELVTGQGLKMYYIDDAALTIAELKSLTDLAHGEE